MKKFLKTLTVCLLLCGVSFAEETPATGVISGKVMKGKDTVEKVPVVVINSKKEKAGEAVTDAEGKYEIKELKNGLYTVKALPPKEMKLGWQESAYVNLTSGKPGIANFALRDLKETTIVFPKGFDENNTKSPLNGLLIVQLQVNNNKPYVRGDGVGCHYPVGQLQDEAQEGLLKWDLSSIPSGTQIVSAKLGMFCTNHYLGTNSIGIHMVKVPWTDKANWTTYDGVKEWQKAGGTGRKDTDLNIHSDYIDVPAVKDPEKINKWFDWDVTEMVQKWVNKEEPNYGMKTKTLKTASISCFGSATYGGTNFIKLTIIVGK